MFVFDILAILCCLRVVHGTRDELELDNPIDSYESKAADLPQHSSTEVLQRACNVGYQLDKLLPAKSYKNYAVRTGLGVEDDIYVIGAESALLEFADFTLIAKKESDKEISLVSSGGHHCKQLNKAGDCGRVRVKLTNVKIFKKGKVDLDWPDDTWADVSVKVRAHLQLMKGRSCGVVRKMLSKCEAAPRWKIKRRKTSIDFNILSLGRGAIKKLLNAATWSGYLDRLVRQSIDAALKNLANSNVGAFGVPLDRVGELEWKAELKPPSEGECVNPDSCFGIRQVAEASAYTGKYSGHENVMDVLYALDSAGLNITGDPMVLEWCLGMARPLLEGLRKVDVNAKASLFDDADGTQILTTNNSVSASLSASESIEQILKLLKLVAPQDFQEAYKRSEGWLTATFQNKDGSSINLAMQNLLSKFDVTVKVSQAGRDGQPIWVVQTDRVEKLLSLDSVVCQKIVPNAKVGASSDLDLCKLLGGGVQVSIDLHLSATASSNLRRIELCMAEPCGGRQHLAPSHVSMHVRSQNLQVKLEGLDTIEVSLNVKNSVEFLLDLLEEATLLTSVEGPVMESIHLGGSRECSGLTGSTISGQLAQAPAELTWKPSAQKREQDLAKLQEFRKNHGSKRLLFFRLPADSEDPDAVSWTDEAIKADLSLRIRPADEQTRQSLCSEGQIILELSGKDNRPAEIELTLQDPWSSSSILKGIFMAGRNDGLISLRLALRLQFAVADGELQKCMCGCCTNEVIIEDISFKDKPISNWVLGRARWLLDGWIQDIIGDVLPKSLGPVVQLALQKHSIEGSDIALTLGLNTELGGTDLVLTVKPELKTVKLTPTMRERDMPVETDGEFPLDKILPAVGFESFGEVFEIQPNILAKLIAPIMDKITIDMPKDGNRREVVSVPVQVSLAKNEIELELRDVYTSSPVNRVLKIAEVFAAQPTEDANDCFLEDRPVDLLPRPHRVDDISRKLNLQEVKKADYDVHWALRLERGLEDFQHRLTIDNSGQVRVNVQELLRPLFNDPGTNDWGFVEKDFGRMQVKRGDDFFRSERNVKLACGALYMDDGLEFKQNLVNFDDKPAKIIPEAKSKPCINIHDGKQSYSICSGTKETNSKEDALAIAQMQETLQQEQDRQRRNFNRLELASEKCREEITGGSQIVQNFEWDGLDKLSHDAVPIIGDCLRACGATPACHSIELLNVLGKTVCHYFPYTAAAERRGVAVSKAWHLD